MVKRPTLVCINFHENRARRYVPKVTGGFFTENAKIGDAETPAHTQSWGDDDGRRLIEEFRNGEREGQQQPTTDQLPEYA
jgi:hypothetical protein